MHVIDHINQAKDKTLFSFEILPPLKGKSIASIYKGIDPLMEFDPKFINVTYHRQEFEYKKRDKGYLEKVAVWKRPGTVGICAAIQHKYKIDAVPHLICGGFTKDETENALLDLHFLGINNVLALRGDAPKNEKRFIPETDGNAHAVDLVKQINALNQGKFLDDDIKNPEPTNFNIGVAGYPEKHFECPNMAMDIEYLKQKVDAGASYVVTQLFYDNEKYFAYVDACRAAGINVPIVPGIKPINTLRHIEFIPSTFFIDFPVEFTNQLMSCKTDQQVREVGIKWTIKQCQELIQKGVPVLHFYTMGKSEIAKIICKEIY